MIAVGGINRREPVSMLAVVTRACVAGPLILLACGIDLARDTTLGTIAAVVAGGSALASAWTPREPLVSLAMIAVVVEYGASSQHVGDRDRLFLAAALSLVLLLVHSLAGLAAFVPARSSLAKVVLFRAIRRGLEIGGVGFVASVAIGLIGNLGPRTVWLSWVGLAGVALLLAGLLALFAHRPPSSLLDSVRSGAVRAEGPSSRPTSS